MEKRYRNIIIIIIMENITRVSAWLTGSAYSLRYVTWCVTRLCDLLTC